MQNNASHWGGGGEKRGAFFQIVSLIMEPKTRLGHA